MNDAVLSPAAIALAVLAVLEEREEEEEGGGNEVKGGYPAAHREFVEKIKDNQWKLEEAMAPLVAEALGMSRLRFVNARTETEASAGKKYSVEPEMSNSSPADSIRQEISRAEESETEDGSLGITSDGRGEKPWEILMQHGTKSEAGMKQAIVEDLVVMFFVLVEWFEHKEEENKFVIDIFISQDELIRLANAHTLMKQRQLFCEEKASFDIAHG
ncbi:uncharacterized protein MONOS_10895 [Monocercomonoides exilis]|uniref:uncharacterized protein n=1 Tax=Monocercomonoides exilis TaxID=2049356 RepID=UPI00355A6292|nr:hypothetical protein MONOS_10895 [Monocercomonoides exilis]|eukprot:MONOS_10895.1-p1 / transcript=MONOS_10895.1 / gene=MONOS_10895 / organism=Monocercomonoides_exilis_PA203 / gene_product=unspecified product / transcript_product=unspecified product / location=Mono_scaffold00516:17158-18188(+) / protein_length=215 / sequence_SO=supercontig / SO=protein_coding / is_pseudo=false